MECLLYAAALVRVEWQMKSFRAPIGLASFLEKGRAPQVMLADELRFHTTLHVKVMWARTREESMSCL